MWVDWTDFLCFLSLDSVIDMSHCARNHSHEKISTFLPHTSISTQLWDCWGIALTSRVSKSWLLTRNSVTCLWCLWFNWGGRWSLNDVNDGMYSWMDACKMYCTVSSFILCKHTFVNVPLSKAGYDKFWFARTTANEYNCHIIYCYHTYKSRYVSNISVSHWYPLPWGKRWHRCASGFRILNSSGQTKNLTPYHKSPSTQNRRCYSAIGFTPTQIIVLLSLDLPQIFQIPSPIRSQVWPTIPCVASRAPMPSGSSRRSSGPHKGPAKTPRRYRTSGGPPRPGMAMRIPTWPMRWSWWKRWDWTRSHKMTKEKWP